jgi:long-chain acyl-CoA synthetase
MSQDIKFYHLLEETAKNKPNHQTFRRRLPNNEYKGVSFQELLKVVDEITAGIISSGTKKGDKITLLCDASAHWIWVDLSILTSGAVSVPRGTDVVDEDITYIVNHSESEIIIVQNPKTLDKVNKLKKQLPTLKKIYIMEDDKGNWSQTENSVETLRLLGVEALKKDPNIIRKRLDEYNSDDLATLIYTSGTTGAPKGVMLSQKGWMNAIENTKERVYLSGNDRAVSLLPPWHAFERAIEYASVVLGIDFLVSNISNLKEDLRLFKPTIFPSVPRIWENVYNGIYTKFQKSGGIVEGIFQAGLSIGVMWFKLRSILMDCDTRIVRPNPIVHFLERFLAFLGMVLLSPFKFLSSLVFLPIHNALGGSLRISMSAGSALPQVVDRFLSGIGLRVLDGYGMTETSAVISIRKIGRETKGTVGTPVQGYQIRIKDEKGNILEGDGRKGTLWVKSNQVMKGYFKREDLNKLVFDQDGFFDTGDIMTVNYRGELMFTGRAKDTIVLAGGENVEPVPIEDKLISSAYIDQVLVIGQDKKNLGVMIVPNFENIKILLSQVPDDTTQWNQNKIIREFYKKEILKYISRETGFKSFELIPGNCFYLMPKPFDPDKEVTRTLKIKRNVVHENYKKEIEGMYL